ncbi:WbqC family protein [Alkaliphilus serpentinus]|uniref:WbqC family protein n=2 Tax=Alkaliphilus serpentinus TaxID=1482731 RepID=A0A833HLU3_9FIRM|nr:WbqC family protein [Alkaliphilus serpentinus]
MQPYLFPYIGYFQLINAVDTFLIYDDVQFIKGGWINRNRLLINGTDRMFIFNIKKDSYKANINERYFIENIEYEKDKFIKSIYFSYKNAPYFTDSIGLIENIVSYKENNLSKFIINSIKAICNCLEINTEILVSSNLMIGENLKGEDRIIFINKNLKSNTYINAIGGKNIYSHQPFNREGINLHFIQCKNIEYKQFNNPFINNLSIIDVFMFNSKEQIKKYLCEYELIK